MTDIALITGASRGIGRATALALAASGTDVVLTYRLGAAEAQAVVAEIEALGRTAVALELDAAQTATFPAFADALRGVLADRFGRDTFDALVNNAGIALYATAADTTEEDFDRVFAINVKGVFFLTQQLLGLLADGGRVVNLSSGLARFTAPAVAAYAATKGAIEVYTRHLAQELGPRGITVNTFAPGVVATDFGGGRVRDDAAMRAALGARAALGRVGEPEDVGPAIAALLSPANHWITGQRIEASGGVSL